MNKIIFDTDIGGDCDDAGALAILHEAQNAGKAELLAVTLSTSSPYAAGCADAINRYYGHIVPIGQTETKAPGEDENFYEDSYGKVISEAFENGYPKEEKPQSAVRLLRRLLAENTGEKITIVAVGNFENLAAFLTSGADDISPLTGKELMLAQAERVVAMACFFPSESVPEVWFGDWKMEAEFNVAVDIPSARTTLEECPVPVYFSHYLTGMNVLTGARLMKKDEKNPAGRSYYVHSKGNRSSWDPAAAFFAVYGCGKAFEIKRRGKVTINEKGVSLFQEDASGSHYLIDYIGESLAETALDEAMCGEYSDDEN